MNKTPALIIISSFPSLDTAHNTARVVLQEKLSACVQIQSPMTSLYIWKNTIEENQEYLVYFKTLLHLEKKLYECIKQHHPYDCPEIISVNPSNMDETYQQWMISTCQK